MQIVKDKNISAVIWQLLVIILLNIVYVDVIAMNFDYMGFSYLFDTQKFVFGIVVLIFLLSISLIIKNALFFAVWHIMFIIFMVGEVIFYQYNPDSNISMIIVLSIFFVMLALFSIVNVKIPNYKRNFRLPILSNKVLILVAISLFIPYFVYYYEYINLKNLFLIDVYETRELFREVGVDLLNYVTAPLSRILLPVLVVISLEKKKYMWTGVFSVMILYVYLAGALKSVLFGLAAIIIFYLGTHYQKGLVFIQLIAAFCFGGLIFYYLTDSVFFLDIFVRRIFFIPPYMNNHYVQFFTDNFTFFSHSPIGLGIVDYVYDGSLSMYVGEHVVGTPGLNANVGLFTEGYFSLGYIGGFLMSFVVCCIFSFFNAINIDAKYFGIVFVYIYYINTAFLSVLLVTHGLLFLIIFSYFYLRDVEQEELNYNNIVYRST